MTYRKSTLRKLPPIERQYCRLVNDLESALTRLKNFRSQIHEIELKSRAEEKRENFVKQSDEPLDLEDNLTYGNTGIERTEL